MEISAITDALYDAFGQRQISTIFTQASQYRVVLESATGDRIGPQALQQLRVAGTDGVQVPLATLARIEERQTELAINHIGQFPAVNLSLNLAPASPWARRWR